MGPYLPKPVKDKKYKYGQDNKKSIRYYSCGMQGWRKSMEDAHIIDTDIDNRYSLFGIFDGHGGPQVARFCKIKFPGILKQNLKKFPNNPEKALNNTFIEIDQLLKKPKSKKLLQELQQQQGQSENQQISDQELSDNSNNSNNDKEFSCNFIGCTANVVLYNNINQQLIIANAGDAKCVMLKSGQVKELTTDHKPDNSQEKNRIENAGGQVYGGRVNGSLNVSRALGDLSFKNNDELRMSQQLIIPIPDITFNQFSGDPIEFFTIGCDGVWEKMGCAYVLKKIENGIINKIPMKLTIEELFDDIISSSCSSEHYLGCDNMSLIVVLNNTAYIQEIAPQLDQPVTTSDITQSSGQEDIEQSQLSKLKSEVYIEKVETKTNTK